ncbi:hypothetical protein P7C70_g214, partial [Phenoliferia sp. Uapishka_3]
MDFDQRRHHLVLVLVLVLVRVRVRVRDSSSLASPAARFKREERLPSEAYTNEYSPLSLSGFKNAATEFPAGSSVDSTQQHQTTCVKRLKKIQRVLVAKEKTVLDSIKKSFDTSSSPSPSEARIRTAWLVRGPQTSTSLSNPNISLCSSSLAFTSASPFSPILPFLPAVLLASHYTTILSPTPTSNLFFQ